MTTEKSNKTKCEVCGYALPLNATICPNCGGNLSLIQMIKAIPPVNSIRRPASFPAMVSQPEESNGNAAHPGVSAQKRPVAPAGVLEQRGARIIGVNHVVLNRKKPAPPARALNLEEDQTNAVQQVVPDQRFPAVPAMAFRQEGNSKKAMPQVAPDPVVLPQPPAASSSRLDLVRDQGGIRLPQIEEPVVRNAALKRLITQAVETVKSNLKSLSSRVSAAYKPRPQRMSWSNRFLKDWVLPTVLISAMFFVFMEYLAKNYEARASGISYQDPQGTMVALGDRVRQAESTILAQQETIYALQSTAAAQPYSLPAQAMALPTQIDLSKTLILGPLDGSLGHSNDGLINTYWAGQDSKNFSLYVVLVNPYSALFHPWDMCIRFRRMYTNEYRLTIFSTQQWTLSLGLSTEPIASGTLTNLKTGEAESNAVALDVVDGIASLKVNDVLVPGMDVSAYQESGDVGIAIGTQKGDEVEGKSTIFREFTLWNIP